VLNAFLVPDLLYAIGGPLRHITFDPTPGTILTASPPAAVANGSAIGVEASVSLCNNVLARMMHTSPELRRMYTANGGITSWPIVAFGGLDQRGEPFQNLILDFYAAPLGAFSFRDGIDTGSPYWMPKTTAPNVEQNEQVMPILYLYRREMEDSGGAGRFVGGATIGVAFTVHKTDHVLHQIATCGVTHPTAPGLFGGYPGPPSTYRFVAAGSAANGGTRILGPKESNLVQVPGDVYEVICTGAAGYGDPLAREPEAVAADVAAGRFSAAVARELFGVVADGDAPDAAASAELRDELRRRRLELARPGRPYGGAPVERLLHDVTEGLRLGMTSAGAYVLCSAYSGRPLCSVEENYRACVPCLELPIAEASPLAADPSAFIDVAMEFRLYLCPDTGALLETEVARAGDPPLHELALDAASVGRLFP
jgi:N-methylhydantoinase B